MHWIKHLRVPFINMKKVDVPQVLISSAAIFGVSLLWFDFKIKVFQTVRDLLSATFFDKHDEEDKEDEEEGD